MKIYDSTYASLPNSDNVETRVLSNGIKLLTREINLSPSVVIKGYLSTGSIQDPDNLAGLANFTASVLSGGTEDYDFQSLHNIVESLGANFGINCGNLTTSFSAHCLSEDLFTILTILAQVLEKPTFPEKHVNRIRGQLLSLLDIISQDTNAMASITFDELLYRDHPYHRRVEGYPDTIQKITRNNLIEFHRHHYRPEGMVIAVVGSINSNITYEYLNSTFGSWHNQNNKSVFKIPEVKPLEKIIEKHISLPEKQQTDIVMGTFAPSRLSDAYLPCSLGNNILGQIGLMGRIGHIIREEAGFAYYAYSLLNSGIGPGSWEFCAGVNTNNVRKTIKALKNEIRKFLEVPVTKEELDDTKSYYIGRLPLMHQSNESIAVSLLNIERYNLGLDYLLEYPNLIMRITPEEILNFSRLYLSNERLVISTAGS